MFYRNRNAIKGRSWSILWLSTKQRSLDCIVVKREYRRCDAYCIWLPSNTSSVCRCLSYRACRNLFSDFSQSILNRCCKAVLRNRCCETTRRHFYNSFADKHGPILLDISGISVTMYLYLSFCVHIYRLNTFTAKTIFAAINIIHSSLFTGPAMLYVNK